LLQLNYSEPLSPEVKQAPLWHVSDTRLRWLIRYKQDSKQFFDVLRIILTHTQPSRQEEIWRMMQLYRPNEDQVQAELAGFEVTLEAQYAKAPSIQISPFYHQIQDVDHQHEYYQPLMRWIRGGKANK